MQLLENNRLDTRLRELMIMRIGWITGSAYEWTNHWRVATTAGIPLEDVLAVRDWQNSDRLTAADKRSSRRPTNVLKGNRSPERQALARAGGAPGRRRCDQPAPQRRRRRGRADRHSTFGRVVGQCPASRRRL
jgi:alkylhydroperoxidase family enzyme